MAKEITSKQTSKKNAGALRQVATNAFIGKEEEPTEEELTNALGTAKEAWDQLLRELAQEYGVTAREWNCYSVKRGWALRLKRGKRTIVWLSPCERSFGVAFIFGDKALSAFEESKLPKTIIKALNEAPKYPEGTGLRLEVKTAREIPVLKKLVAIKIAN